MKNDVRRILIAGYEIGGQMQLLAETIRNRGIEATSVAFNEDFRGFSNDIQIKGNSILDRFLFLWAKRHYDVFHFFWGISLLEVWRFHLLDLPFLRLMGKKIIPHFRGLDIIDIGYFDYLRNKNDGKSLLAPPISRKNQIKRLSTWIRYSNHILLSEPDLFHVVPSGILSPQVIDLNFWKSDVHPLSHFDNIIRVVHAPTSRRKKGTEYVEKAIESLKLKGFKIELILIENLQSHAIKELYEKADIGIDQLLYGWHGKVSCELMAMKKPVICFIDSKYYKYRPDLPLVNANPNTLESKLEELLVSRESILKIGEAGFNYVKKYHDVEVVVDDLLKIYGFNEFSRRHKLKINNVKQW